MRIPAALSLLALLAAASPAHGRAPRTLRQTLVKAKEPLKRESAALALGAAGDASAVPTLLARLKADSNLWVRARCAEALGRIGDRRAAGPLRSALAREKNQRVRRAVAQALMRLGQRKGLLELMWQLKAGTNHSRAEAMKFLVRATGQPLGQDVKAWWTYFARRGYRAMARRPAGAPAVLELGGATRPRLLAASPPPWRQLCAALVQLRPSRAPLTAARLRPLRGRVPDGCLLLIDSGYARAKPKAKPRAGAAARRRPRRRPRAGAKRFATPPPASAGLTADGLAFLLRQAPRLTGVAVDTPQLAPPAARAAVQAQLARRKLLALDNVGKLSLLPTRRVRLLLIKVSAASRAPYEVLLLALLP